MKPIYLFADSQFLFWKLDGKLFLRQIRDQLTSDSPKAAYIGASNGDLPEFYELFREAMRSIGIADCRMIRSAYPAEDASFLAQADLILLAGGDIEKGWKVFQETGLRDAILDRHFEGAILIGVSAGAIQLGLYACIERGPQHQELLDACALVPFLVDTHHEKDDWSLLQQTMTLMDKHIRGIGIPSGGGAIYHSDQTLQPVRHFIDEFSMMSGKMRRSLLRPAPSSAP